MNSIEYRLARFEDLSQLIELRALMQFKANQLSNELVTPEYLEKVKTFFSNGLKDQSYSSTVAVLDKRVIATADGLGIYRAVGYKDPSFVNLEIKFN
jgi:hypothetical protein